MEDRIMKIEKELNMIKGKLNILVWTFGLLVTLFGIILIYTIKSYNGNIKSQYSYLTRTEYTQNIDNMRTDINVIKENIVEIKTTLKLKEKEYGKN